MGKSPGNEVRGGNSTFLAFFISNYFRQRFFYEPEFVLETTYSILTATWPICDCPSPPMLTERHVKTVKQPKAIRYRVDTSPLQRSVQRSLLLRAVTETALNSPFLYVNRSPIRYGFRACAKAIRLRTIVSSREFVFNCAILNHFY